MFTYNYNSFNYLFKGFQLKNHFFHCYLIFTKLEREKNFTRLAQYFKNLVTQLIFVELILNKPIELLVSRKEI